MKPRDVEQPDRAPPAPSVLAADLGSQSRPFDPRDFYLSICHVFPEEDEHILSVNTSLFPVLKGKTFEMQININNVILPDWQKKKN